MTLTFDQVPELYGDTKPFAKLLFDARNPNIPEASRRTVRVARFGDSTGSWPSGAGYAYGPKLQQKLHHHFGNTPESIFLGSTNTTDGIGGWPGMQGAAVGAVVSSLTVSQKLAGYEQYAWDNTTPSYGFMIYLGHQGRALLQTLKVYNSSAIAATKYLDTSVPVYAEVFGSTRAASGTFTGYCQPTDLQVMEFFAATSQTFTFSTLTSANLSSGTFNTLSETVGPLNFNGKAFAQVRVLSSSATPVEVCGMRFKTPSKPGGVIVTSIGTGGIQTNYFETTTVNCGPTLKALNFDACWLATGINDEFNGVSAVTYKARIKSFITWVRAGTKPDMIIILTPQHFCTNSDASETTQYDMYAGVMKEVCDEVTGVLMWNTRLLSDRAGFNASTESLTGFSTLTTWSTSATYVANAFVSVNGVAGTAGDGGDFYTCFATHGPTAANHPTSQAGNNYWRSANQYFTSSGTTIDTAHLSINGASLIAEIDASMFKTLSYMGDPGLNPKLRNRKM